MIFQAAIHLPDFPVAALHAGPAPAAVTATHATTRRAQPPIVAANATARAAGIRPGWPPSRALARCPDLRLLPRDPEAEAALQSTLLALALAIVPDVESTTPGTLVLDPATCPEATAHPRRWLEAIHGRLTSHSPVLASIILAGGATPDLAHLAALAPHADPVRLATGDWIATWPLDLVLALHPLPDSVPLDLWGIETVGRFLDLPPGGLLDRLGPASHRLRDLVLGRHHRPLRLVCPPTRFRFSHDFEDPVETLEPILFLARRAIHFLTNRLDAHHIVTASLDLDLTFTDGAIHHRRLRVADPTNHHDTLARILHAHLESLTAPAPLASLALEAHPTAPPRFQHDFLNPGLRDPNRFAETLSQIEAALGTGRVGHPAPSPSHHPSIFSLIPHGEPTPAPSTVARPMPPPVGPPLARLRPAVEITVTTGRGGHHPPPEAILSGPHTGPVLQASGPYPLSGQWWDPATRWHLIEWDVALANTPVLRIARHPGARWTLEGRYA